MVAEEREERAPLVPAGEQFTAHGVGKAAEVVAIPRRAGNHGAQAEGDAGAGVAHGRVAAVVGAAVAPVGHGVTAPTHGVALEAATAGAAQDERPLVRIGQQQRAVAGAGAAQAEVIMLVAPLPAGIGGGRAVMPVAPEQAVVGNLVALLRLVNVVPDAGDGEAAHPVGDLTLPPLLHGRAAEVEPRHRAKIDVADDGGRGVVLDEVEIGVRLVIHRILRFEERLDERNYFHALVGAVADHAGGIRKLSGVHRQLMQDIVRRRVVVAIDVHVINVQIDGVQRYVAGDGGVGEILHPALVEIAEARELVAERPLRQHGGTAGELGIAVNDGSHRVVRAAAEEEIVQLPVARLEGILAAGLRAEPEQRPAGVVEKEAIDERRHRTVGRLDAVEEGRVHVFGIFELGPVVGSLAPAFNLLAAPVQRAAVFAETEDGLVGGQHLGAFQLEVARSPAALPGVVVAGIKLRLGVVQQVESALVLEVHLERNLRDDDIQLRRRDEIRRALVGEADAVGNVRPIARLQRDHRLLLAPQAREIILHAHHVGRHRRHRRLAAVINPEVRGDVAVRAVHRERDVGDVANRLVGGLDSEGRDARPGREGGQRQALEKKARKNHAGMDGLIVRQYKTGLNPLPSHEYALRLGGAAGALALTFNGRFDGLIVTGGN